MIPFDLKTNLECIFDANLPGLDECYRDMMINAILTIIRGSGEIPQAKYNYEFTVCPKCGYATIRPAEPMQQATPNKPAEPDVQINNKTTAQWIRKKGRLICPYCAAETSYFTNWCSVCGKELM